MLVRPVQPTDIGTWVELRIALWPDAADDARGEALSYLQTGAIEGRAHGCFLAESSDGAAVGFAEVSECGNARCHLEGWYVVPAVRRRGVGRALIKACEQWAAARGASRFTSDTNDDYPDSPAAHAACGFEASADRRWFERRLG
ncbi:MAG: GNAT family N-acetyltransferase [Planctomycetota bacterium]